MNNLIEAKKNMTRLGYLELPIEPTLDLFSEIEKMKKEKEAIILAHYYQDPDIQDVADCIGDSLGLAQKAQSTQAKVIVFCGVHFMAETAKILNPGKKVLLPDLLAGCSLADSAPADKFKAFKNLHQDHIIISYINCSAEVKAMSDIICTSSNAKAIIEHYPIEQKIIFAPDKNLGAYLNKETKRSMVLWDGACVVHENFNLSRLLLIRNNYPNAKFIAHPECEESILALADFIGSTTALLRYTQTNAAEEFIVGTETGIIHQMKKSSPHKTFIPAPPSHQCVCNDCAFMKRNTLEKLYLCLKYELPEILMPEDIRIKAYLPIKKMLEFSEKAGS